MLIVVVSQQDPDLANKSTTEKADFVQDATSLPAALKVITPRAQLAGRRVALRLWLRITSPVNE